MKGYEEKEDKIVFILEDNSKAEEVYVVGNFMGWEAEKEGWKMSYDEKEEEWRLEKGKKNLNERFNEFTFIVDGEWLDADEDAENVIHCAGYGYRYTIA